MSEMEAMVAETGAEARYAGFWIRFLADIIDSLLLTIVSWVIEGILLYGFYRLDLLIHPDLAKGSFVDAFTPFFVQMFNLGIYTCLAFPYYVMGHFKYQTTLGKRPFGIYVVDAKTHESLTVSQSILRCVGYVPSYLLFCAGFLMAAMNPRKQGLHDLIASSVSIRR